MSKAAELAKMGEVLTNSQIGGRRNLFYNSKFEVAQRGTSFSGGTSALYGLDRWHIANGSSFDFNVTVSQSTTVPSGQGFKHSLKVEADVADTPTGSENGAIQQKLEAQDVQQLMYGTSDAKTLTLSFWVRSNKTGTYCVQFMTNQGNSTVGNRYVHVKEYTINSADTWEKKILVLTGHTAQAFDGNDNSDGFRVTWHLVTGADDKTATADTWTQSPSFLTTSNQVNFMDSADNEWYLCGCQLEVGSYPNGNPFEHRSFGDELSLCQRYYQGFTYRSGGIRDSSTSVEHFSVGYLAPMRATPSLTLWDFDKQSHVVGDLATNAPSTIHYNTGGISFQWASTDSGYRNFGYRGSGNIGLNSDL